ncbi:MAG: rane protein of unknown function [Frankiales bacterium]|nr:rane protein of unknown function [Frankiales bacterium]
MTHLSWTIGLLALVGSGSYVLVYLWRWEWHRALLVGLLFVAALVVMATALVLRRLTRLERRWQELTARGDEEHLLQVVRSAPRPPTPFSWLGPEQLSRTGIFIPVLLGSGVVLSGLSWLVERVAGGAARSGVERELAHDLGAIAFPTTPLVPSPAEALTGDGGTDSPGLRLLLGPAPRRDR